MVQADGKVVLRYSIIATDPADGKSKEFHGTQDQRWHTVATAKSLLKRGFSDIQILHDGEVDAEGMNKLFANGNEQTALVAVDPSATNGLAEINAITKALGKQANNGSVNSITSAQFLAKSMEVLRLLGVTAEQLRDAAIVEFPDLAGRRSRHAEEVAAQ